MPVGERGWWHLFSLLFLSHCSRFLSQHTHKNKNVGMWFSIGRMDGAGGNFFFLFLWTSMGFGVLWRDRQITSRTVANMKSWKSNLVDPAFVSSFEINVPQREWKTTKRYIYAVRCNRIRASHLEFGLFQKPKKRDNVFFLLLCFTIWFSWICIFIANFLSGSHDNAACGVRSCPLGLLFVLELVDRRLFRQNMNGLLF